jgi:photosynthetic reaction center H subunit
MIFSGEFVNGVDLVDVCLWAFTLFFLWLIYYLQREGMREGYPLEEDPSGRTEAPALVFFPPKKSYNLPNGRGTIEMTYGKADTREHALNRTAPWAGSPFIPSGDPMKDGVGPASYAMRDDVPDLNWDGTDRIAPYRLHPDYTVSEKDLDPRGLPVVGLDRMVAGSRLRASARGREIPNGALRAIATADGVIQPEEARLLELLDATLQSEPPAGE